MINHAKVTAHKQLMDDLEFDLKRLGVTRSRTNSRIIEAMSILRSRLTLAVELDYDLSMFKSSYTFIIVISIPSISDFKTKYALSVYEIPDTKFSLREQMELIAKRMISYLAICIMMEDC